MPIKKVVYIRNKYSNIIKSVLIMKKKFAAKVKPPAHARFALGPAGPTEPKPNAALYLFTYFLLISEVHLQCYQDLYKKT